MAQPPALIQGNEACTAGALAAGCRFFAGYPITPSTEIAELMSERLPRVGGKFIQMEDEIASLAACLGASLTGLSAMTATSGPGFSLMQENIGYAAMAEIPVVIVNVQRLGPSTGMPTSPSQGDVMQARWGTHGDHPVVVLTPSTVREVFELTVTAFEVAERLRIPVILLMDEVVAHMRERVELPAADEVRMISRRAPTEPPGPDYLPYRPDAEGLVAPADFGTGYRVPVTGLHHGYDGFPSNRPRAGDELNRRLAAKVSSRQEELCLVEEEETATADTVVVAYGATARAARRAVREARAAGHRAGLLVLKTLWPFPAVALQRYAGEARRLLVPEMNLGQLVGEVERGRGAGQSVAGLSKVSGELFTPREILEAIIHGE